VTVNLTRIYTKLGDGGETHLGDMSRVPKTHPRIEAYGAIDELNAQIGLTLTVEGVPPQYADWLRRVQNDLFDVGADLSVPPAASESACASRPSRSAGSRRRATRSTRPRAAALVRASRRDAAAAHLHVCRTVCRRAERRAILVEDGNPEVVRYLNRLSDLLFILSRGANAGRGAPVGAGPLPVDELPPPAPDPDRPRRTLRADAALAAAGERPRTLGRRGQRGAAPLRPA
jgi:cob(I)alamin adenosyltransferase